MWLLSSKKLFKKSRNTPSVENLSVNLNQSWNCGNRLLQEDLPVQIPCGHGSDGLLAPSPVFLTAILYLPLGSHQFLQHTLVWILWWFILPCPTLVGLHLRSMWALVLIWKYLICLAWQCEQAKPNNGCSIWIHDPLCLLWILEVFHFVWRPCKGERRMDWP